MQAIWQLIDTTIIPIITYASEGWIMTKKEQEDIQKILNAVVREVLKMPEGTPTTILMHESGYIHTSKIITKKKIMQGIRIEKIPDNKLIKQITRDDEGTWKKHINELMERYYITPDTKKSEASRIIDQLMQLEIIEEIHQEAKTKTKIKHWMERTDEIKPAQRPEYMNKLTRKQCTAILKVRTRMLPVLENRKTAQNSNTCRWCKTEPETQIHIIDECHAIRQNFKNHTIKYEEMFQNHPKEKMTEIANHINDIIDQINEKQTSTGSP